MLFVISGNFSREYKYTVGQELKNEGLSIIKNIYQANKAIDKVDYIDQAGENLEIIRLLIRLMQDFKQISLKLFVEINQAIEMISKQLIAWGRYSKTKSSALLKMEIK